MQRNGFESAPAQVTMHDWSLPELAEGMSAHFQRRIASADIDAFAQLSGDINPLHMDAAYAREHGYGDRVAHGALLSALASRLIGTELPGRRALLLNLRLEFVAPTYAGDVVDVMGTVTAVHEPLQVIQLRLVISCGQEVRARGSALVRILGEPTG